MSYPDLSKEKIACQNDEMKYNIPKTQLKSDIDALHNDFAELKARIDTQFRWLVGIMITMWVTVTLGIISTILTIIFKS